MAPVLCAFIVAAALGEGALKQNAAAVPAAPVAVANAYRIGQGDVLSIVVLGQDGLGGDFVVEADGMMTFPFVGRVKVDQHSTVELERKLAGLLADGYLKRPQVGVAVKEYRSQRVFVAGEVQSPGAYGLRPDRSLISLLREIGPLTANVGHEVVVIRPPASAAVEAGEAGEAPSPPPLARGLYPGEVPGAEVFHASLRDLRSGYPERDIPLHAGDTVYLPKAAQVYVTGHVARPGAYRYEEGMTVFQLVALAGGATERGSEKRVKIARLEEGRRKDFRAKPADLVLPEDTVHIPERFF